MFKLLFFLYSSIAFSICNSNIELPLADFIQEMTPILEKPWAAATDEQVTTYNCQESQLTVRQMNKYLNDKGDLSASLNLLINKEATTNDKAIVTDLKEYGAENCETNICKAKKIFGQKEGIELLYMIEKYGLNGSHLVHKDTKPWTSNTLAPYLKGLAAVPSFMLPINKNQQFTKSSLVSDNIADASITFHAGIDKFSDKRVTYTTFHEIAHYVAGSIHVEDDEKWMQASGWREDFGDINFADIGRTSNSSSFQSPTFNTPSLSFTNTSSNSSLGTRLFSNTAPSQSSSFNSISTTFEVSSGEVEEKMKKMTKLLTGMKNDDKNSFISLYAQKNPLEDIAESITAYRFNPQTLKTLSPKRYEYLKERVFLGVEYLDESLCESARDKRALFQSLTE